MARRFACGVPPKECKGANTVVNTFLGKNIRTHGSPEQAFSCYSHWLTTAEGYTQLGPREFQKGPGEPHLILDKKCRFGVPLRPGKAEKVGATRFLPICGSGYIR